MLEITKENFEKEVLKSEKLAVVDFWAPWCVPCKVLAPTVKEIDEELKGRIKVGKSNVDENPELATELSVLNIPTLVLFKDGKEAGRMIGINSKEAILGKINTILGKI